jgi:ABC-type dipeptide/oligopeptide/nickel transport system permease component
VFRHVLKNAFIPVVTLMGVQVGFLVGGQVLIENVFNIPGMGRLMIDGVLNKDYPIVMACTILIATIVVSVNILIDIVYGWLDPRIRYE